MKKNRKRWYPEEGIPGKFLRKMKLILFLCWAGMMQVSAMSYAQTGTVSIRVKETALHEIFQLIEAQCGYAEKLPRTARGAFFVPFDRKKRARKERTKRKETYE